METSLRFHEMVFFRLRNFPIDVDVALHVSYAGSAPMWVAVQTERRSRLDMKFYEAKSRF